MRGHGDDGGADDHSLPELAHDMSPVILFFGMPVHSLMAGVDKASVGMTE
jgi:hypothetical protein